MSDTQDEIAQLDALYEAEDRFCGWDPICAECNGSGAVWEICACQGEGCPRCRFLGEVAYKCQVCKLPSKGGTA